MKVIDALATLSRINLTEDYDDVVTLYYNDLDLGTINIEPEPNAYTHYWKEPSARSADVVLDDFSYDVPKEDIIFYILENDMSLIDYSDEEAEAIVNDQFDFYLDKNYNNILDYFRDKAVDAAIENGEYY